MTEQERMEIDWHKALQDAEWLAGSTADTDKRNLAMAYLAIRKGIPDIDWHRAMADAEWLAGSTADTAERNLAMAYLAIRKAEMAHVSAWMKKQMAKESGE